MSVHFPPFVWGHILGFRAARWVEQSTKRYWKACFDAVVGDIQANGPFFALAIRQNRWRVGLHEVHKLYLRLGHPIFRDIPPKYREYNNGYDSDGYDRFGYDRDDFDIAGYDRVGYDRHGEDQGGYDRSGYRGGFESPPMNYGKNAGF
jgi:hypothetical protein